METKSCHNNQSSYPTGIKNITFVEGNVLCKYAKIQLHPPQPIKSSDLDKSCINMEDYSINISVIKKIKYPYDLAETVNFHFSHYKSMESLSCHSNQSSYPTEMKKT